MSDYLVSKSLVLNQQAQPRPAGPAITALQQANIRLEQSMPKQQPVPAYQPQKAEVLAEMRARSGG